MKISGQAITQQNLWKPLRCKLKSSLNSGGFYCKGAQYFILQSLNSCMNLLKTLKNERKLCNKSVANQEEKP